MPRAVRGASRHDYRPEIDGLRAVAVVPVVLFHAGYSWFRGGFVGVDVFFVISGYLITRILLADDAAGRFSIGRFYERRARRILPALLVVLAATWFVSGPLLLPDQLKTLAKTTVAVCLFSSNIFFALTTGYFDPAAEQNPLLHTWSLGVEEQFYIGFPILLAWTLRGGRRRTVCVLSAIALGSFALAQWMSSRYPVVNFFVTPPRAWELMIGALVACVPSERLDAFHPKLCELLAGVGLTMILSAVAFFGPATPFPSVYTLLPTIGAALIVAVARPQTVVGRALAAPPLVGIGLVSYSAYLWHQPLFAFARIVTIGQNSLVTMGMLSALTFLLAAVTWRYVETPLRNGIGLRRHQVFWRGALATGLFLALGFHTYWRDRDNHGSAVRRVNFGLGPQCAFESAFSPSRACMTADEPHMLVWGDSFGMHLMQGVVASDHGLGVVQATKSNCGPLIGVAPISRIDRATNAEWAEECRRFGQSVLDYLGHEPSIKIVVLASPFEQYADSSKFILATATEQSPATPNAAAEFMRRTVAALRAMGKRVVLVAPPPSAAYDVGACADRRRLRKLTFGSAAACIIRRDEYLQRSAPVQRFLAAVAPVVPEFSLDSTLCDRSVCSTTRDNVLLYRDPGHLSYDGSAYLGRLMQWTPRLEALAQ